MHVTTSQYLTLLRLLAALTVLVGHASVKQVSDGLLWQVGSHGQDAVAVFFVLSGFVIGYVTHRRESSATVYILHRVARIYSVAIPALLLTFALNAISCHYKPAWPETLCTNTDDTLSFMLALAFVGEVWSVHLIRSICFICR